MGTKMMWTAVAVFLISPLISVPAASIVAAIFAIIGITMIWLDK